MANRAATNDNGVYEMIQSRIPCHEQEMMGLGGWISYEDDSNDCEDVKQLRLSLAFFCPLFSIIGESPGVPSFV